MDPAAGLTPEQYYDRQWALTILERVMLQLEGEHSQDGKARHFEELKGFLVGGHSGDTYRQAAGRLEISEVAARKAASRMRRRYRELLRGEIAQTVAGPEEVDDEIRNLFSTLQL
jgi:RNA polymerase sigma-70 factor (ECF subfamily)